MFIIRHKQVDIVSAVVLAFGRTLELEGLGICREVLKVTPESVSIECSCLVPWVKRRRVKV